MSLINVFSGFILLTLGRKLFWLFVGCLGFASGFIYAPRLWEFQSDLMYLVIGLVMGAIGALLAIFLQSLAIGLSGFAAGGYITMNIMDMVGLEAGSSSWLPPLIGGIIGAVLLFLLFDWALIFLSSLSGASLVVQGMAFNPTLKVLLFFGLIVLGLVFQTRLFQRKRQEEESRPG